ncbi:TPA: Csa1 family protein, partial [Staphylococcus aureus]|nr:Csa1 family protein [Staphylococcus aureus]
LLKGSGDLKGSSVGYKDIEFTFVEKKGENTFLLMGYILTQVRINNYD